MQSLFIPSADASCRLQRVAASSHMTRWTIRFGVLALLASSAIGIDAQAKGDNFNDAVKLIERHYRVKHKGIPFLAKAGIKTAVTVARIAGGSKRRLAEAGSVKVAYFEDQDFSGNRQGFRSAINAALGATWSPLIQVQSGRDQEQVYIFLRSSGDKFNVMVITIEPRDATVVQVDLRPENLKKLMQDPDDMGRAINAEATADDE